MSLRYTIRCLVYSLTHGFGTILYPKLYLQHCVSHVRNLPYNPNTITGEEHYTFDLFSRMSTRKSLDAQHQGFF